MLNAAALSLDSANNGAICACMIVPISNNSFAFDTFGLRFLGGNTLEHQESLDFRLFGAKPFGHLAGLLGI